MRRLLALFLICLLAAGCGTQRSSTPVCHLVLESGEGFRAEDPVCTVRQGADAVFALVADPGYSFAQADYPDYSLSAAGGRLTLTLHRVQYSGAVSVTFAPNPIQLRYHGNGGNGPEDQTTVSLPADTAQLRPNTSQGAELFQRAGHTLYAWNTLPDGSGSAVGLGSRTDCGQAGVDLYAQWQPWTDSGEFLYEQQADGAAITGYQGNASLLCIPARLDGLPVTCIRAGAFAGLQSETVILAPGLKEIEAGAFQDAAMCTLYLFDDLEHLDGQAFSGCNQLQTLHINAASSPRYTNGYFASFADKFDRLLSLAGQRKLILFAGSSARFGYDSTTLRDALPGLEPVNMGVFAYTGARAQLRLIETAAEPGDVLLHTPEFDAVRHQFCTTTDLDPAFFCMTEGDYDTIARLDMREFTNLFPALAAYLEQRQPLTRRSYQDSPADFDEDGMPVATASYNEYGDYVLYRPNAASDEPVFGAPVDYTTASFSQDDVIAPLNNEYRRFLDNGVCVLFGYAPRNRIALSPASTVSARAELDGWLRQNLCVPVLGNMEDSLVPGRYLYGTDNHLSTEGVALRTARTARELQEYLCQNGLI